MMGNMPSDQGCQPPAPKPANAAKHRSPCPVTSPGPLHDPFVSGHPPKSANPDAHLLRAQKIEAKKHLLANHAQIPLATITPARTATMPRKTLNPRYAAAGKYWASFIILSESNIMDEKVVKPPRSPTPNV